MGYRWFPSANAPPDNHDSWSTPSHMNNEQQDLMAVIVRQLGRGKAVEVVMAAYNTELVSNRMARMETSSTAMKSGAKDLLLLALKRVAEVCALA